MLSSAITDPRGTGSGANVDQFSGNRVIDPTHVEELRAVPVASERTEPACTRASCVQIHMKLARITFVMSC